MIDFEAIAQADMRRALMFGHVLDSIALGQPPVTIDATPVREGQAAPATKREKVGQRARSIARLIVRDGDQCFYCRTELGDDITLEHLDARVNGGADDLDNLRLAHSQCNRAAGHLPEKKKLALRSAMSGEVK